ncbi:MAG: hypothetical protein K1X74_18000 [Pirellulales bacterium]|nr:hypothetical protein [Pirellulales bacterium]
MADASGEDAAVATATHRSPADAAGGLDRELFWFGVAAFVLSRVYITLFFQPQMSDVEFYFTKAVQVIDLHRPIYGPESAGKVELGYPPGAWWLMALPRVIDPRPWTEATHQQVLRGYYARFRLMMAAIDLASFALLAAALRRLNPALAACGVWGFTLCSFALAHVLYDKTDLGVWACVCLWAWCWTRRDATRPLDAWTCLGLAAVGFGVAVKLVTAVMVPFLLIGVWQTRRRASDLAWGASIVALAAGLPFAVYVPTSGSDVLLFLARHGGRSLQLESTYASLLMLVYPLGVELRPVYEISAWHLAGPVVPAVRLAATVCTYAGFGLAIAWAWWRRAAFGEPLAFRAAALAPAALLCVAHVLSPQYFVWGLGVLVLVGVELRDLRRYLALLTAALAVAALTTFVFPYHLDEAYRWGGKAVAQPYNLVRAFHWIPRTALVARNGIYVALVAWLVTRLLIMPAGRRAAGRGV